MNRYIKHIAIFAYLFILNFEAKAISLFTITVVKDEHSKLSYLSHGFYKMTLKETSKILQELDEPDSPIIVKLTENVLLSDLYYLLTVLKKHKLTVVNVTQMVKIGDSNHLIKIEIDTKDIEFMKFAKQPPSPPEPQKTKQ